MIGSVEVARNPNPPSSGSSMHQPRKRMTFRCLFRLSMAWLSLSWLDLLGSFHWEYQLPRTNLNGSSQAIWFGCVQLRRAAKGPVPHQVRCVASLSTMGGDGHPELPWSLIDSGFQPSGEVLRAFPTRQRQRRSHLIPAARKQKQEEIENLVVEEVESHIPEDRRRHRDLDWSSSSEFLLTNELGPRRVHYY